MIRWWRLAQSLDIRKVAEVLLASLQEVDPAAGVSAEDGLARFVERYGIDIRAACAALGSHWTFHAAAADGGWLGAAVTVDIRDPREVQHVHDRLIAHVSLASDSQPGTKMNSHLIRRTNHHHASWT